MNKKIKDLASLCLNNHEFNELNNLLTKNQLNKARLYIDNLIENIEYQIENEIFNLYVEEDEGEQIKQSVGQ